MNPPFQQPNLAALAQEFHALDATILAAAARGLAVGLRRAAALAQQKYLSGPRPAVLDAATGRLRAGLNTAVEIAADRVTGSLRTSVPYASTHEFGLLGHPPIPVKAHQRTILKKLSSPQRIIAQLQQVRAHMRINFTYPGRPFLAPALAEAAPIILDELHRALAAASPA